MSDFIEVIKNPEIVTLIMVWITMIYTFKNHKKLKDIESDISMLMDQDTEQEL